MEKKIKNQSVYSASRYFMPTDNGVLLEISIDKIVATSNGIKYYDGNGDLLFEEVEEQPVTLYKTPEDFREGNTAERVAHVRNLSSGRIVHDGAYFAFNVDDEDNVYVYGFTYKNGDIVRELHYPDRISSKQDDNTLPEGFYDSRATCLAFNRIIQHDIDGTEKVIGGELLDVLLSEKQKEILARLSEVLDECEKAHIGIYSDQEDGVLRAYNAENKGLMWYDGSDGNGKQVPFYEKAFPRVKGGSLFLNTSYEWCDMALYDITK